MLIAGGSMDTIRGSESSAENITRCLVHQTWVQAWQVTMSESLVILPSGTACPQTLHVPSIRQRRIVMRSS